MKLSQETMIELMSYADGELEGDEKARVEKLLSEDIEARRFVSELSGLGDEIRLAIDDRESPRMALADGIADVVMASIAAEKPEKASAIDEPVVRLDELRARRMRQVRAGASVVAALALAAGVFFLVRPQAADERDAAQTLTPPSSQTQAPSAVPPPAALTFGPPTFGKGVDVDHIESPSHQVSVFYLPTTAHNASASVVVWIDDKSGGGE